jgi:hypothetical protein
MMKKRKNPIRTPRTTIASVNKEMQQPRLTESVRNGGRDRAVPVAKELAAHSTKV